MRPIKCCFTLFLKYFSRSEMLPILYIMFSVTFRSHLKLYNWKPKRKLNLRSAKV